MAHRIQDEQDGFGLTKIQAMKKIVDNFKEADAFDGDVCFEGSDGHYAWDAKLKTAEGLGISFIVTTDDTSDRSIFRLEFHTDENALQRFMRADVSVNEDVMGDAIEKLKSAKLITKNFGYEDDDSSLHYSVGAELITLADYPTATATFDTRNSNHILCLATVIIDALTASGNLLFLNQKTVGETIEKLQKMQSQNKKTATRQKNPKTIKGVFKKKLLLELAAV